MKREVLFRGVSRKGGKMIYGDLRQNENFHVIIHSYVYTEVMPGTVSQYTGKTDKNGNKIFEGDVVRYRFIDEETGTKKSEDYLIQWLEEFARSYISSDKFKDEYYLIQWSEEFAGFYLSTDKIQDVDSLYGMEEVFEVVGNIFENPELADKFKNVRNTI